MKIAFDVDVIKDLGITRMVHQVAEWGYKYIEQSPHPQINPFYKHPRASREIMAEYKQALRDTGLSCRRLSASTAGPARTNCAVRRR
ncbi:glyceraldehyde-3-phosphate ketol-isomerase [Klebsiella pneumoniae]|uniref:Glyceraldehyde-3-phosphate ketol-isomerase n=1 Tax=Klebsiella pneumoniae TaxID=573 RepID=A0A378FZS8_KLEPN|nr:glyceraldehyde-3-phosphate ketol-isomerase [Klebsiella pneumoniae]